MLNSNIKKILRAKSGFTLVEVLVVMGMVALVASLGLFVSMDSYRSSNFRGERSALINDLYKARSQALNNVCLGTCGGGAPHGVHFESGKYTIFQGESFLLRNPLFDEVTNTDNDISISGPTDIIFSQLAGNVTVTPTGTWNILLTDNGTNLSTISLNSEGQLKWTN
jgi:prepilin-type N-terminal cleavage/methylation domain-containing protein